MAVVEFSKSFELANLKVINNASFDIYVAQIRNSKEGFIPINDTYYKSLIEEIIHGKSLHRLNLSSWEATEIQNVTNGFEVKIQL